MQSQEICIRPFVIEDYSAIIELWESANLPYRPVGRDKIENVIEQIQGGNSFILVAELNGKIIGTVWGTHDGRKGWINRLAVDSKHRREHVATRLILEVEKEFEKIGIEVFAGLIEADNTASMEVFKQLGYEDSDIRYFSKRKSSES